MILSIFFFQLAAICNAVMDTITHHWDESIFDKPKGEISKWDMWWNPEYSWINKYTDRDSSKPIRKILGIFDVPFTDAWHTFKSTMIILLTLSVLTFNYSGNILGYSMLLIVYGFAWNLPFNLFYNRLLIKK